MPQIYPSSRPAALLNSEMREPMFNRQDAKAPGFKSPKGTKEAKVCKVLAGAFGALNFSFFGPKFVRKNDGKKLKFYDIAYLRYHIPYSGYDVNFFEDKRLLLIVVQMVNRAA